MAVAPIRCRFSFARAAMLLSLSCLLWAGCSGETAPPADQAQQEQPAQAPGPPPGAAQHGADGHGADPNAAAMAAGQQQEEAEPPPPGEAPFDTAFLDVNTELFIYAQVADILQSSLVQTLTGGNLGPLQDLQQQTGIDPADVQSVTVGVVDVASLSSRSTEAMQQFGPMAGMGPATGMTSAPAAGSGPTTSGELRGGAAPPAATPQPSAGMHSADPSRSMHGADPSRQGAPPMSAAGAAPGGGSPAPVAAAPANAAATADGEKVIAVIRTKSPINLEALERDHLKRLSHGETAYYRTTEPVADDEAACLYLAEPSVLVVSDEATIRQIIDAGEQRPRPSADLGFVKKLPHLLIAVAPRNQTTLLKDLGATGAAPVTQPAPGPGAFEYPGATGDEYPADDAAMAEMEMAYPPGYGEESGGQYAGGPGGGQPAMPQLKPDQKLFEDHTQAVALLVDLSQGINLDVAIRCDSAESAGKVQAELDRNLTQIREQFETSKAMLPGVIQQLAQPLVDSLTARSEEAVVSVSTQLPEEKQSMLTMLPMAVMGMMMSGGMQMDAEFESMASRRELAQRVIDEGQPAGNADELPAGLQVKGLAQWGESLYGDQAPPPLEIGIVALGGPAAQAIAIGGMELTDARIDAERQLKWLGTSSDPFDGNALTGFVPIQRDGILSDHPDEGVGIGFLLQPPAEAAGTLQSVSGQFLLQIAGRTEDVLLTNLAQLRGAIDDARLASARMSIDMSRAAQGQLDVSWNESPQIGKVELVTSGGVPFQAAGSSTSSAAGRRTTTFALSGPPPQDLALRVATYADLQEVAVPFRFENLPLPEPQELSEQQRALLVWTRSESPKDYPDLIIEAQGRWRDLELVVPERKTPLAGGFGGPGGGYPEGYGTDPSMEMEMQMEMQREMAEQYNTAPPGSAEGYPGPAGGRTAGGSARPPASDEPLRIVIDLIGPLAQSAEAIGEVNVTLAKSDIDTDLTFEGARVIDKEGDPVESFIDVTGEPEGPTETPPGARRVIVNLTPPNQPIGGISQLNGSLKLRTVRERTETILSDLQSRVGPPPGDGQVAAKPITDRELNKFGLKPVVAIEPNRVMMRLLEGKDERISSVSLLDLNGVPITGVNASVREGTGNARGRKVYAFEFPNGVPQKIGMKISVNMGVRDITIPIRLRDMPLPPMPQDAG